MFRSKATRLLAAIAVLFFFALSAGVGQSPASEDADVIIIGAGIGGLSAAWEAGRHGMDVLVLDMFSVFGGHAVMSEGGLCIVDTPLEREKGVEDSPELAKRDFIAWGKDANEAWVDLYARKSKEQIYDWLTGIGVEFNGLRKQAGNRAARFHTNAKRGLGIVDPIYRECLRYPNIQFQWNAQAISLLREGNRVTGVRVRNTRSGKESELRANAVVVATGGYQSSLDLVKRSWPEGLVFPENLLLGSGINAVGSGLELAQEVGGATSRMDHQWNYPWGMVDPRFPGTRRGLNARIVNSIWVNNRGKRFVNEVLNARDALAVLLRQAPPVYWAIFDENGKRSISIAGTDWIRFERIEKLILENPTVTAKAGNVEELAAMIGIAPEVLRDTVTGYNRMADAGIDPDFRRFGPAMPEPTLINDRMNAPPKRIETPPFYAIRFGPITRKSMGGIEVDLQCRVLNTNGDPIPGLYAVGEVTGFGGINGSAGLEGTFLGPAMFQGRRAGQNISEGKTISAPPEPARSPVSAVAAGASSTELAGASAGKPGPQCQACHQIPKLLASPRKGYTHFELVHAVVSERGMDCAGCHAEMAPFRPQEHKINRLAQTQNCAICHMGTE